MVFAGARTKTSKQDIHTLLISHPILEKNSKGVLKKLRSHRLLIIHAEQKLISIKVISKEKIQLESFLGSDGENLQGHIAAPLVDEALLANLLAAKAIRVLSIDCAADFYPVSSGKILQSAFNHFCTCVLHDLGLAGERQEHQARIQFLEKHYDNFNAHAESIQSFCGALQTSYLASSQLLHSKLERRCDPGSIYNHLLNGCLIENLALCEQLPFLLYAFYPEQRKTGVDAETESEQDKRLQLRALLKIRKSIDGQAQSELKQKITDILELDPRCLEWCEEHWPLMRRFQDLRAICEILQLLALYPEKEWPHCELSFYQFLEIRSALRTMYTAHLQVQHRYASQDEKSQIRSASDLQQTEWVKHQLIRLLKRDWTPKEMLYTLRVYIRQKQMN